MGIIIGPALSKIARSVASLSFRHIINGAAVSEETQKKASRNHAAMLQAHRSTVLDCLCTLFTAFLGALQCGFEKTASIRYIFGIWANAERERTRVLLTKLMPSLRASVTEGCKIAHGSILPYALCGHGQKQSAPT